MLCLNHALQLSSHPSDAIRSDKGVFGMLLGLCSKQAEGAGVQVSEGSWWDMDAAALDDRTIAASQERRDRNT